MAFLSKGAARPDLAARGKLMVKDLMGSLESGVERLETVLREISNNHTSNVGYSTIQDYLSSIRMQQSIMSQDFTAVGAVSPPLFYKQQTTAADTPPLFYKQQTTAANTLFNSTPPSSLI